MTGTVTDNPFYDALSQADPEKLSDAVKDSLGMEDTGEDKEIAGTKCNIHKSAQFGSACFTDGYGDARARRDGRAANCYQGRFDQRRR